MPTYQYICKKCGFELEELQSMSDPPLLHCPNCKTDNLARIFSSGSGLIFKGSGFYQTDYKNKGKSSAKSEQKKDSKEEKPSEKKQGKTDTPPKKDP